MDKSKLTVFFFGVLTLFAVGAVLTWAKAVVLPLIIAWLLSYILGPPVKFLTRRRVPTPLAVALVLVLLLGICYLGGIFLHARVSAFVEAYPKYDARLTVLIQSISDRWERSWDPFAGIDWSAQLRGVVGTLAGSLLSFVSNLVMVIIFLVFMLLGQPYFAYKIRKALSPTYAGRFSTVLSSISAQISRYLIVQFLISLATGVCVWLALHIIGVDFAVTWGALAFFLNFIPNIGSIIASIPPVLLAFVQFYPAILPAIAALVALLTIQMVIGSVIPPKVMGDHLNLSPVVVLLSLVFWGWLWGVVGALLSIPIAAAIKITCENIEALHPISVMMGAGKTYKREFES